MARPASTRLFALRHSPRQALVESLLVLAVFVVAPVITLWARLEPLMDGVWGIAVFNAAVVGLSLGLIHIMNGDSWTTMGLSRRGIGRESVIGAGLIVPCYALSVLVGLGAVALSLLLDGTTLNDIVATRAPLIDIVADLPLWSVLPAALLIGFTEELLFRGFLLGRLAVVCRGPVRAVVVCALLFGALHVPSQGWLGFVQTGLAGIFLGIVTVRRNSVWAAAVCHAGVNVVGMLLAAGIAEQLAAPPA